MQRVVLWSGGPDSTKCLIDMLEQTDDPVIAFHLHGDIPNVPMDKDVIEGERNSINALTPIIKERYRDFELKEFTHRRFTFDKEEHIGFEIHTFPIIFALNEEPTTVYIARNLSDHEYIEEETHTSTGLSWILRDALFESVGIDFAAHNLHKPKGEIINELGDLYAYTWSCIGPTRETAVPCGKCVWCKQREKGEKEAEQLRDQNGG